MRVLKWMVERIQGTRRDAEETPIGWIPRPGDLDTQGMTISTGKLRDALRVDAQEWLGALEDLDGFYKSFGARMPQGIAKTLADTQRKLRR
jgi:phosphoenolpyruvate carboxykinase (GTP)